MHNRIGPFTALILLPFLSFAAPRAPKVPKPGECIVITSNRTKKPHRKALLIGNGAYTDLTALKSARLDAINMAAILRKHGFVTTLCLDLGKTAMQTHIKNFLPNLVGSDEFVFYYSGHAAEVFGQNYLFPVDFSWPVPSRIANNGLVYYYDDEDEATESPDAGDASASAADAGPTMLAMAKTVDPLVSGTSLDEKTTAAYADLKHASANAISLNKELLDNLVTDDFWKKARTAMNLVILDACRTEIFRHGKGVDDIKGLVPIIGPPNTYIAFAAAPDEQAIDGLNETSNSPFTAELLKALRNPAAIKGKDIDFIFRDIRTAVWTATSFRQHPWSNVNLSSPYVLVP